MKRIFIIIPAAEFRMISHLLYKSIGEVSWLLLVLPRIAANEPMLCLIWEQIANPTLCLQRSLADAATSLVSLVKDNERCNKLIIEEGVPLMLKIANE
ncbi:uncharacterized protein Pyn_31622 [Prunus yedoensis var. nudiflora]|uniref:DUF7792 domain-containing protein n=1 Tax=Prunus yedoensis var. nudiflora TaxID=2094558 RepID=A0A314YSN8_PRUYE|nr:uncharacterized protein Pyn_31622 [Prunus yedoensis var. nudiflora]